MSVRFLAVPPVNKYTEAARAGMAKLGIPPVTFDTYDLVSRGMLDADNLQNFAIAQGANYTGVSKDTLSKAASGDYRAVAQTLGAYAAVAFCSSYGAPGAVCGPIGGALAGFAYDLALSAGSNIACTFGYCPADDAAKKRMEALKKAIADAKEKILNTIALSQRDLLLNARYSVASLYNRQYNLNIPGGTPEELEKMSGDLVAKWLNEYNGDILLWKARNPDAGGMLPAARREIQQTVYEKVLGSRVAKLWQNHKRESGMEQFELSNAFDPEHPTWNVSRQLSDSPDDRGTVVIDNQCPKSSFQSGYSADCFKSSSLLYGSADCVKARAEVTFKQYTCLAQLRFEALRVELTDRTTRWAQLIVRDAALEAQYQELTGKSSGGSKASTSGGGASNAGILIAVGVAAAVGIAFFASKGRPS